MQLLGGAIAHEIGVGDRSERRAGLGAPGRGRHHASQSGPDRRVVRGEPAPTIACGGAVRESQHVTRSVGRPGFRVKRSCGVCAHGIRCPTVGDDREFLEWGEEAAGDDATKIDDPPAVLPEKDGAAWWDLEDSVGDPEPEAPDPETEPEAPSEAAETTAPKLPDALVDARPTDPSVALPAHVPDDPPTPTPAAPAQPPPPAPVLPVRSVAAPPPPVTPIAEPTPAPTPPPDSGADRQPPAAAPPPTVNPSIPVGPAPTELPPVQLSPLDLSMGSHKSVAPAPASTPPPASRPRPMPPPLEAASNDPIDRAIRVGIWVALVLLILAAMLLIVAVLGHLFG